MQGGGCGTRAEAAAARDAEAAAAATREAAREAAVAAREAAAAAAREAAAARRAGGVGTGGAQGGGGTQAETCTFSISSTVGNLAMVGRPVAWGPPASRTKSDRAISIASASLINAERLTRDAEPMISMADEAMSPGASATRVAIQGMSVASNMHTIHM